MENSVRRYDWCYISGRVNFLECSLLSSNFFERLLSTNDFKDILTLLNNTPLKAYFGHVKHLYECETLLDEYYCNRLYEIRSLSPDSAVCDFFLLRNDVHNLKRFIKSKIFGASMDKFFQGTFSEDELDSAWQDKSTALPEIFRDSVSFAKKVITRHYHNQTLPHPPQNGEFDNYSPIEKGGQGGIAIPSQGGMKKKIQSFTIQSPPPSQGGDQGGVKKELLPFIIDLIFDGAYLRYVEDYCKKIEVEIIKRYLETYQLVKGLEVIRRAISLRLNMNLLNQYFLEGFEQNHLFRKLVINNAWASKFPQPPLANSPNSPFIKGGLGGFRGISEGMAREINVFSDENLVQIVSSYLFPKISYRYEVATDNYLLDILRPVKYIPFGPERVFGYLCGFAAEVFNLKLVLGGKVRRIAGNLIQERLRNTYV